MASIHTLGASNFYYYGKPSAEIANPTFPPGQKITTRLPSNVAKIRIVAALIATAYVALRLIGPTMWCLPVVVLGVTFAAYIAFKHLLAKDPLVDAFYAIAGGKEGYHDLPEMKLDPSKKTFENFDQSWESLEHPMYRFTTSDGRKGVLIKGLSNAAEPWISDGSTRAQAKMIFVEKLGPYDMKRSISNLPEWGESALRAISYEDWENKFTDFSESYYSSGKNSYILKSEIYASISSDMVNEFIAQRGVVNRIDPKVMEVL